MIIKRHGVSDGTECLWDASLRLQDAASGYWLQAKYRKRRGLILVFFVIYKTLNTKTLVP